jgi:HEAT repeat protein
MSMSPRAPTLLLLLAPLLACCATTEVVGPQPVESRVVSSEARVAADDDRMGRTLIQLDRKVDEYVYLHFQPGDDVRRRRDQVETYLRTTVGQNFARLVAAARDAEHPGDRIIAAKALAFSKDPGAVTALGALLERNLPDRLLAAATWSLGQIQSPTTPGDALLDLVLHSDRDVRNNALVAMWHSFDARVRAGGSALDPIAHDRGLSLLQASLGDPADAALRAHAAACLGAMGDPRAVEPLIELLKRDDDPFVRTLTAFALAKLGDRRALPSLALAIDGTPEGTPRTAVITAIRAIAENHGVKVPRDLPGTSRAWGRFVDERLR